jgi:hypothetical protein
MSNNYSGQELNSFEFCPKCGCRLIKTPHIEGYDPKSGNPVVWERAFCPNNKFFNIHFDVHFNGENNHPHSDPREFLGIPFD